MFHNTEVMISKAFPEFFIERHACDEQFIKMARVMGIPDADKPEDFINKILSVAVGGNSLPLGGGRSLVNY